MRQLSVAHENAHTSGVEILLARGGDSVDDADPSEYIPRAAPTRSMQRQTRLNCPVDVGKLVGFHVAAGLARAREHPKIGRELLLQVDAHSEATAVATHRGGIRWSTRRLRKAHGFVKDSHAPATVEDGDHDLARPAAKLVTLLQLQLKLELVKA